MSIRFLKLSLASPESIRSWTERVLPNGKRVGKILKGDLIDYKNGLPIRDGLSCERIFGPMVSFTCTCGRFKCIETRGIHIVHDTLRSSRPILPDVSRQTSILTEKQFDKLESPFQSSTTNLTNLETSIRTDPIVSQNTISKPIQKPVSNEKPISFPPSNRIPFDNNQQEHDHIYENLSTGVLKVPSKKLKLNEPRKSAILQPIAYNKKKITRFLSDFYYDYESVYHFNKNEIVPSFVSILEEPYSIMLTTKNSFKPQKSYSLNKRQIVKAYRMTGFLSFIKTVRNKNSSMIKFRKTHLKFKTDQKEGTSFSRIQSLLKPLYKFVFQIYTGFWFDLKMHSNNFVYEKHIFLWTPQRKFNTSRAYNTFGEHLSFFSKLKIQSLYDQSHKLPIISGILPRPTDFFNFPSLPRFLILSNFFAKIIRNNTVKKTNPFFFKTKQISKVHNNWHSISILRNISSLKCFFKGVNKISIYWSQRNQKIELPYVLQFYIESKFSAALHAPKIKIKADRREETSFPAEPFKKYSQIIALYFVQQIKINHKAMFLEIPRSGVLNEGTSIYQRNRYAYKVYSGREMLKKNIINNIDQKLGLEINLFKKNVSTKNIPNEISLLMQKPIVLNNLSREKELDVLFGSVKISRFDLKQKHSNSLKNILSTFKKKNRKSQSRVWKVFQNSAFSIDRDLSQSGHIPFNYNQKENGHVDTNTFSHSEEVNHIKNTDGLSALSGREKPRNKKNKFLDGIFDKKLFKPVSIFDSFKKQENINKLHQKTVSFKSNQQSGLTKASHLDRKKPVLSLDSQSSQMEELFSPKYKTNIVPSGLSSTPREDTSKPYVGSNTKQNIRVYKFKNFPPEEIRYCPYCEVELLPNSIRRYRLGYIEFVSPVTHIWYTASSIPLLLNLSKTMIEGIASCHEALSSGFPPIYKWSYNGESPTSWTFQMQPLKLPINSVPKITPINEILNYNRVKKSNSTEIIFGSNSTILFSELTPLENYKRAGNKAWIPSFRIIPHKISPIPFLRSENNLIIYEKRIKNPFIKNAEIDPKENTTSGPSVLSSFEKIPAQGFKAVKRQNEGLEKESSQLLYQNSNRFNPPINMVSKNLRGSACAYWREKTSLNHHVADIFNVPPILRGSLSAEKETYIKKTDQDISTKSPQSIKSGINFPYLFWKDISYNFKYLWIFEYPFGKYLPKNNWFVPVSHKALTLFRNDLDKHASLVEKTNGLSAKQYSKTVQSFSNQKIDFTPLQKKSVTPWININNQQTKGLSLMLTKRQTWPFFFNQYISSFINLLTRKSSKQIQYLFFPLIEKPVWSFYPKKEDWLFIKKFSPFLKVELESPYQRRLYLLSSVSTDKRFPGKEMSPYSSLQAAPLFFRKNKGATAFLKGEKRRVFLNTDASVFNISNEIMRELSFFNPTPKKADSHYDLDTATDYEKKREWLKLEGFFEDPSNQKLPNNSQVNLEIDNKTHTSPDDSFKVNHTEDPQEKSFLNQKSSSVPHGSNKTEEKNENDSESFDHLSLPLVLPFLGKNPDNIEFKSNYFNHENFHTDPLKFIIDLFTTQYIWDYTNLGGSVRADKREGISFPGEPLKNNQDSHKLLDQDPNLELFADQQQYNDTWNNVSIGYNDLITSLSNIYNMPGFFYTNKTVQKKPPRGGLLKKCFSLKKFKYDLSVFLLTKNHYQTNFWPSLNRFYINNDNWFSKTYPFLPVKSSNSRFQDILKPISGRGPVEGKTLVLNEFPNMEMENSLNSKNNSLFLQDGYSNQINTKLGSNNFNLNDYHENYQNCFRKLGRNAYYFKLELMTRSENAFLKNLFFRNKFQKTNFFKANLLVFPFISTSIFHSKNDTNKIILKTNQLKLNQNFTIGKKTGFLFGFYLNVYNFNFFTPYLPRINYPLLVLKKRNSFFSSIIKQSFINFLTKPTRRGKSIKILARMEPYKFFLSKENIKNSLWPLKSNSVSSQTSPIQLYYNSFGEEHSLEEFNQFSGGTSAPGGNPFSQKKNGFFNIKEFYGGNSFYTIKKGDGSAGKQEKRIRSKNNYQKLDLKNFDRALYKNFRTLQLYSKNTFQKSFPAEPYRCFFQKQPWAMPSLHQWREGAWPFLNSSFNLLNDGQITKGLKNEQKLWQKVINSKRPRRETKKQKSIPVSSLRSVGVPVSIIYDFTLFRSSKLIKNTPSLETKQIKNKNQWLKTFEILCIKKRLSRHPTNWMALKKWTKNQNFLNRSLTKNLSRGGFKSSWFKTTHRGGNNHKAIPSQFLFYTYKSAPEIKTCLSFKQVPLFFEKNKGAIAFVKEEKKQLVLNTNAREFVSKKQEYSFKVGSALKQIVDQIPHQKFLFSKETKRVKQKLEPLALLAFDTTKIEFFGSLKIYAKRKFLEIWHYQDQNFRNNTSLLFNRLKEFKLQTERVPNKKYVYAKLTNGIFPLIKINKEFLNTSRENNENFVKRLRQKTQQFLVYPKRNAYLSLNIKDKPLASYIYQRVYAHDHKAVFSRKTLLGNKQIVFDRFFNSFQQWPYNIEFFLTKQQKQLKRSRRKTSLNHGVVDFFGVRPFEKKRFPVRKQILWFSFYQNQSQQKFLVLPWKKLQFLSKNMILTKKKKKISHILVKSLSVNNTYSFNSFQLTKLIIQPEIVENLKHLTIKHHKNMICYAYAIETIQKKKRILLNSTIPSKSIKNVESELSSIYPIRLSQAIEKNPKSPQGRNHIQSLSFKISCFSYFGYGSIASLNLGHKLVIQKKSLQGQYQQKLIVQKIPKQIPFLKCFQQASFVWKNTNVEKLIRKTPVLSARAKPRIKNSERINYIQSNYNLNPRIINSQTFWVGSYIQILKWGERGHIFDELSSSFYKTNNSINHKVSNQFKNSKHNPTKSRVDFHPYHKIGFKNDDPFLFRNDPRQEINDIPPTLNWRFEKLKQKDQTWNGNTNYYGCISQITSWGSDHGSWILFLKYIRANIYKGDQLLSSYFNKMTFQMMPRTGSIMLQQLLSQLVLIPKHLDQNPRRGRTNFISKDDESVSKIDTWPNFETNWSSPAGRNKDNYTNTQKSINEIDPNLMMIRNQSNQYFHYNSSFFYKCFIPGKLPLQEKWRCSRVYSMKHIDNPKSDITSIKNSSLPFGSSLQERKNKWSSIYYQTFSIIDGLIFFQKNLQKTIQKELYCTLIKKPVYLPKFDKRLKYKLRKPHKFFRNLKNIIDLKNHTNDVSLIKNKLYKHKSLKTNVTKPIYNDIIGFETRSQLFDKYVLSAYKIKKPIAHKRFKQIYQSYSSKPINNWYRLNNFFSLSQNQTTPLQVQNIFDTNKNIVILLNQIKKNQNPKRDYSLSDPSMLYYIPSVCNDIRILKLIYSLIVSFQLQFLSINRQTKQYNNWFPSSDGFQNNKELFNALPESRISNTSSKAINDYTTYKISNTYYHIYSEGFRSVSPFLKGQKHGRVHLFDESKNRNTSLVPHFEKFLPANPSKITRDPNQNSFSSGIPAHDGLKQTWWYSKSSFLDLLTKKHFMISNTISLNKYHHSLLENLVWLRSYSAPAGKLKRIFAGTELFSSKPWLLKKNNLSYMLSNKERNGSAGKQNTTNGVFKSSSHQNDVENFYFSNQKIKIYNILISPLEISKSWSSPSHQVFNFSFPTTSYDAVNFESSPNGLKLSRNFQKSLKSPLFNIKTLQVVSNDLTRWNNEWWKWSYVRPINHFISDIKPYSSAILRRTEPDYFSFNENMNRTKNLCDSTVSIDQKKETNNLQKNKFSQEWNNKYQNSLASQFNYILPMNLETYKGRVESEALFLKLKEIGNYNLLMKKKNTLFKTLILKMNSSLSPLSSETFGTNQNQIQLTKTIKNCISTCEAAQKTNKAPLENWNYHSIFEKKNLHDSLRMDTIKTNILPLSFNGSKSMSINALEFFKTWLFLNFVHHSHLDWFNNLQSQYQVYPTRVIQKSLLHGTSNIGKFNHNNSFSRGAVSKFLHVYEYRKNFLLKKIFKQRVYLTQSKIKQPLMIHKTFLTKLKLIQKIYQKQSTTRWIMPNIMKLFSFFNDFWGFETDRLLKRKINTFYDQERNLNKKYEFKPFGPQIKHDSTYSNWKNLKSFKPQFFHLRNTTIESFKNQTRFRLLTVPQIFDLQDQNNVLNRMRKNKIPINIFGPLVFSSSSKPFKKIITFPALKAPEKQFFWGTRNIFDYKKYSLNSLGLENLYDSRFLAEPFNFKKSPLNEYVTPKIFNTNYMTVLDQHSTIYSETYLNPDRPLSSETLFREENLLLRRVSSSYKALLQKAKILEDYPVPDPNPVDSKSICLRLLNGGFPTPIKWNLQNTRLGNKLPLFRPSGGFISHNKPKIRTYFDTNKNTEADDGFRNGWKKPKNSNRQNYGSLSPFIWDGNQNRFKNSAALYVPIDNGNRLNGPSQNRKTTSKAVFSIRDQTKLSALQQAEGSRENKTMTNINDGTSLFFNEKMQTDQRERTIKKNGEAPYVPISEPKTKSDSFFKNQEISLTNQNTAFRKKKRLRRKTVIDLVGNPPRGGFTGRNSTFNYGRNLRKLRLQYLRNFRRLRFIEYLKATYIKPEWMILSLLPVLPPDLRPVIANPRGYITGDINTHYQNVIYRNNNIEKLLDTFWIPRKFYSKITFSNHQKATISMLSSIKSYFYSPVEKDYLPIYQKEPIKLKNCYTISELFSKLIRFPLTFLYENEIPKTEIPSKNNEWFISFPKIYSSIEPNKSLIFRPKTNFRGGVKVLQTNVLESTSNLFSKTQLTNYYFEILSTKSKIQNNNREMLFLQAPIFFGKAPPVNSISTRVYENINTAAFLFLIKKRNVNRKRDLNPSKMNKYINCSFSTSFDKGGPYRDKQNTRPFLSAPAGVFNRGFKQIDWKFERLISPIFSKFTASYFDFNLNTLPIDALYSNNKTSKYNKIFLKNKLFKSKVSVEQIKGFPAESTPKGESKIFSWGKHRWETIQSKARARADKSSNLNKILIVNNESWQKSFPVEPFIKNEPELRNNSFVISPSNDKSLDGVISPSHSWDGVKKKKFPARAEFDSKNNGFNHSNQWAITQDFQKYKKPTGFDLNESRFYNINYKPVLKLYYQRSFFGSNIGIATGYNQIVQALKFQWLQNNGTLNRNLEKSIKDNPVARLEKNIIRTQALHDSKPLQEMQYSLQKAVDALIDNSQKLQSNVLLRKGRPLKSLSDNLKGKEGRFRQHLLGKRVDYSGRSVIVVGPDLKLYECGIPLIMALRLFQPFLILYLIYRFKIASLLATQLIQRKHPMVINLLKKFIETWPVLLNRAPTLHRMNIQAFKIRLVQGKAILLHPLVCSSYNADFDGDQMGVHVPITQQARAESWKLLWSINNSISIASRQPLFLPSQDMVIGNYYLTAPPIDNSLASLIPTKQEFLNLNIKGEIPSFISSNLDQEFSYTNPNSSQKLIAYPSFGRQWSRGFQKMNHYFFSLEEAYQYYLNTVYRFHINTPVWFRFCTMFETSEREKPIEIAIDKSGNTIYTTKYYEKKLKRNRILGKNAFYFSSNYLDSTINEPVSKLKSIKDLMFKNSIQKVVANSKFSTSVFSKDLEKTKTFMLNGLSLYSKPIKTRHMTNFLLKDLSPISHSLFDDNQNKADRLYQNTFTSAYENPKINKAIISSSQIIFNKTLRPIVLNQIIRSTFGRIEFYYEAFHISRS